MKPINTAASTLRLLRHAVASLIGYPPVLADMRLTLLPPTTTLDPWNA